VRIIKATQESANFVVLKKRRGYFKAPGDGRDRECRKLSLNESGAINEFNQGRDIQ
jgi:hypothetical protein